VNDEIFQERSLNSIMICSLFDMDGTLVDSTAGVIGAWEMFAETYPGLDVERILSSK
jgi:beta-phosphoglucomutase-like phosphatase (HAD superfamily)